MIEAIRAKDVACADEFAHADTRQFCNDLIDYMRESYMANVSLFRMTATA